MNKLGNILLILTTVTSAGLWAQDVQVDREELTSIGDQTIRFISYSGPYEFTNTVDQIRSIGRMLGEQVDPLQNSQGVLGSKYRVLHIVNPEIESGLDADILILEADAAVDHINNLRLIIAGYLEAAYGFSGRDAYLIAEFATYYNAVYRQDAEMAQTRYKAPVFAELEAEKIGLDTHFSNWPGQTQMLIPLRGTLSGEVTPDTRAISDDAVIDEMRQEEDLGLESRRGMVDLREEELAQDQEEADRQQQQIDERRQDVTREIENLENQQNRTTAEEQQLTELEEEQAAIEEEQAALDEEQQNIEERTEDVLEMRDEIAEDENQLIGSEEAAAAESEADSETFESAKQITPVWFLMVDDEGNGIPFGRVVKYNLDTGQPLASSEVTSARGRSMAILPESLLIIAGKESAAIRLMLLDRETLEITREGTDDVFPGSLMTVRDNSVYLVTSENGEWRLGRFSLTLEREAVSQTAVEPWTSISFDDTSLYVQGASGEILKLSASTLEEEAVLQ